MTDTVAPVAPLTPPATLYLLEAAEYDGAWTVGCFENPDLAADELAYIIAHRAEGDTTGYRIRPRLMGQSSARLHIHFSEDGQVRRQEFTTYPGETPLTGVIWHLDTPWPDGTVALVAARSIAEARALLATSTPRSPDTAPTDTPTAGHPNRSAPAVTIDPSDRPVPTTRRRTKAVDTLRRAVASDLGWRLSADHHGSYWANARGDWMADRHFPLTGAKAEPAVAAAYDAMVARLKAANAPAPDTA